MQQTQIVEVGIFGDDDEIMDPSVRPNLVIIRLLHPDERDLRTTGIICLQEGYDTTRQIFVEQ